MEEKHICEQICHLIRSNDFAALQRNQSSVTQLLASNNGNASAIIIGSCAIETSIDAKDTESNKSLDWLIKEYRAIFTSTSVGPRLAEYAWDLAGLPSMRVCLKNGMFPHMYRHSRWMTNSKFAEFLKSPQEESTCLETFTLIINLVHTTFPLIPPIMSAFSSNSHMKELTKQMEKNHKHVFYGLRQEIAQLGSSSDEQQFCLKVHDSLLFLLSYLYTEVVVFDCAVPNWIAWNNVMKFSSSIVECMTNSNLQKMVNASILIMIARFHLLAQQTRTHLQSHCGYVRALRNNPQMAIQQQRKVLPLDFEDVDRCVDTFQDLLRCLRFTLTMCTSGKIQDADLIRYLLKDSSSFSSFQQETIMKDSVHEENNKKVDDETVVIAETQEDEVDDELVIAEELKPKTTCRGRDLLSLATEQEETQKQTQLQGQQKQTLVGDWTLFYLENAKTLDNQKISVVGLRILTMILIMRQRATLLRNSTVTESFLIQQTALTIHEVLREQTLVIFGFLLADYKFDPQLMFERSQEQRLAACDGDFMSFGYLFRVFTEAAKLVKTDSTEEPVYKKWSMEFQHYYWVARLEVSALPDVDWDSLLVQLEIMAISCIEEWKNVQSTTTSASAAFYPPVLITRWFFHLHALYQKDQHRLKLIQVYFRNRFLHHMKNALTPSLEKLDRDAFYASKLLLNVLSFFLFGPVIAAANDNQPNVQQYWKKIMESPLGGGMTLENAHSGITSSIVVPLLTRMEELQVQTNTFQMYVSHFVLEDLIFGSSSQFKSVFLWMQMEDVNYYSTNNLKAYLDALPMDKIYQYCLTNVFSFGKLEYVFYKNFLGVLHSVEDKQELLSLYAELFIMFATKPEFDPSVLITRSQKLECWKSMKQMLSDSFAHHKLLLPIAAAIEKTEWYSFASREEKTRIFELFTFWLEMQYYYRFETNAKSSKFVTNIQESMKNMNDWNPVKTAIIQDDKDPDSLFVKVLSSMVLKLYYTEIRQSLWLKTIVHRLQEVDNCSTSSMQWVWIHPDVILANVLATNKDHYFTGTSVKRFENLCLLADYLHSIKMNDERFHAALKKNNKQGDEEEAEEAVTEKVDEEDKLYEQRFCGHHHPFVFTKNLRSEQWFQLIVELQEHTNERNAAETSSRMPMLVAYLCEALQQENHENDYLLLEANPEVWFRLALTPAYAQFPRTVFEDEGSRERFVNYFIQELRYLSTRKQVARVLRTKLYLLFRVYSAHCFQYVQGDDVRVKFFIRLMKSCLEFLQPNCSDDFVDRINVFRMLLIPRYHRADYSLQLYLAMKRRNQSKVFELFKTKYAIELDSVAFLDWFFGKEEEKNDEAETANFSFAWLDPTDFYHLVVRWMILRMIYPNVNHDKQAMYSVYHDYAMQNMYKPEQDTMVCHWLHTLQINEHVIDAKYDVSAPLFYFWARSLMRAPNELIEYPSSLIEVRDVQRRKNVWSNYLDADPTERYNLVVDLVRADEMTGNKLPAQEVISVKRLHLPESNWEKEPDEVSKRIAEYVERNGNDPNVLEKAKKNVFDDFEMQKRKLKHKFVWKVHQHYSESKPYENTIDYFVQPNTFDYRSEIGGDSETCSSSGDNSVSEDEDNNSLEVEAEVISPSDSSSSSWNWRSLASSVFKG